MTVSSKIGGFTSSPSSLQQVHGRTIAQIGEIPITNTSGGKKLVNYSNYTLNPENIINKFDMKNDKFYSTFLKEQIKDYKTDLKNEMK